MAHALACADARRGWVHPSRIDDRNGHHVIAHRCHRRCTHRQPQDDGGHGTTIAREPGRAHHVLVRRQRRAERVDGEVWPAGRPIVQGRSSRSLRSGTASAAHPAAVYKCGTASNGETQVTRTFNNGTPIVVAHFAGTARPNVTRRLRLLDATGPDVGHDEVHQTERLHARCTYTLFGSRRSYNPASVTTGGNPLPSDVVLCRPALRAHSGCRAAARIRARRPAASSIRPRRLCRSPMWRRPDWAQRPLVDSHLSDADTTTCGHERGREED